MDASRSRELLVRSLVWLVSAVVAGVVRDVTLAGTLDADLEDIADQSGCAIAGGATESERLFNAIDVSKYERLMIIEAAYQPMDSLIGELDQVTRIAAPTASVQLLAAPSTLIQRLFPDRAPTVGLFAPRDRCLALRGRDFRRLKTALRPKTTFATRANPIP